MGSLRRGCAIKASLALVSCSIPVSYHRLTYCKPEDPDSKKTHHGMNHNSLVFIYKLASLWQCIIKNRGHKKMPLSFKCRRYYMALKILQELKSACRCWEPLSRGFNIVVTMAFSIFLDIYAFVTVYLPLLFTFWYSVLPHLRQRW